jgi:hypothetical protein
MKISIFKITNRRLLLPKVKNRKHHANTFGKGDVKITNTNTFKRTTKSVSKYVKIDKFNRKTLERDNLVIVRKFIPLKTKVRNVTFYRTSEDGLTCKIRRILKLMELRNAA